MFGIGAVMLRVLLATLSRLARITLRGLFGAGLAASSYDQARRGGKVLVRLVRFEITPQKIKLLPRDLSSCVTGR